MVDLARRAGLDTVALQRFLSCVDSTFDAGITIANERMISVERMGEGVIAALCAVGVVQLLSVETPNSVHNTLIRRLAHACEHMGTSTNSTYGYIAKVRAPMSYEGAAHCLIEFLRPFVDDAVIVGRCAWEQACYVDIAFNGVTTRVCVCCADMDKPNGSAGYNQCDADYHITLLRPAVLGCLVSAADMSVRDSGRCGYATDIMVYDCVNTLSDVACVLDIRNLILLLIMRSIILPMHVAMCSYGKDVWHTPVNVAGSLPSDPGCAEITYVPRVHVNRAVVSVLKQCPFVLRNWVEVWLPLRYRISTSTACSISRVMDTEVDIRTWPLLRGLEACTLPRSANRGG